MLGLRAVLRANTSKTQVEEDQGMFEGDFNIEHNTDNDEGDDYNQSFTHSTFSGGRRSSTSSMSIPVVWPSSHSSLPSLVSLSSCSSHSMNRSLGLPQLGHQLLHHIVYTKSILFKQKGTSGSTL
jgi:hypothetical protein